MASGSFELTARETKAAAIGAWLGLGALVACGLISAIADMRWPIAMALGLPVVLSGVHVVYLARTRRRSVSSVVALLVPERWRHPTRRLVSVVVLIAVASSGMGLLAGRGAANIANALILGVLGAWCGTRLVAPVAEADRERPDAYPFDVFLLLSGLLIFEGITDLLGNETVVEWSAGAWSLPLGVLMLIAEARRWKTWREHMLDENDVDRPSEGATSSEHR